MQGVKRLRGILGADQDIGEDGIIISHRCLAVVVQQGQIVPEKGQEALHVPALQALVQQFGQCDAFHIFQFNIGLLSGCLLHQLTAVHLKCPALIAGL